MTSMSRRIFVVALPLMAVGLASAARAQDNPPANASATLFQNVRIFDGKSDSLSASSNVLVKGNIIERISTAPIAIEPGVTVIAGNGRTADARPDRRTLACDADTARSCSGDQR
jgi:hypothetical protein